MDDPLLAQLQQTLEREMPITAAMGITVESWDGQQLTMKMPLEPNRNHQYSAFAGSLNALCTVVGWGTLFMLLKQAGLSGNIVIRRSTVRYLRPVRTSKFLASSLPADADDVRFFFDLLESKRKSKLDIAAEIRDDDGSFVTFKGSYVVQDAAPISSGESV